MKNNKIKSYIPHRLKMINVLPTSLEEDTCSLIIYYGVHGQYVLRIMLCSGYAIRTEVYVRKKFSSELVF